MAYGIWKFDVAFTRTLQKFLSCVESTQFLVLIPIYLRSILILSSHLRLGLPRGLFSVFTYVLKALLPSSILATWPAHPYLLDLITLIILGEPYILWSFSLWNLLHSPFAILLDLNIRLRILFSKAHSLHFPLM